MGLDLALGGLVLFVAFRGFLKGFLVQAIRLGGLVAAVYAAAPVRDQVKPYLVGQFPSMRPDVFDRLFWWISAVVGYFVIVGVASMVVAVSRRQTFGIAEPNRGDQFAGFGLGVLKGLVMASFVVAGLHTGLKQYGVPQLVNVAWAEEQRKESFAWMWNERYHPAAQIWSAPPVRHFVGHVQKMGLMRLPGGAKTEAPADKSVQTASRSPKLTIPAADPPKSGWSWPSFSLNPWASQQASSPPAPAAEDPPSPPEIDTTGPNPEMADTVESLLRRLQALDASPSAPN